MGLICLGLAVAGGAPRSLMPVEESFRLVWHSEEGLLSPSLRQGGNLKSFAYRDIHRFTIGIPEDVIGDVLADWFAFKDVCFQQAVRDDDSPRFCRNRDTERLGANAIAETEKTRGVFPDLERQAVERL